MSDSQETVSHQLQTDPIKRRVWVHAPDGSTVGRFDTRFGIDIHNTVTEQLNGKSQCLHCTHETPGEADWALFRDHARKHWGIDIPEDAVELEPEKIG